MNERTRGKTNEFLNYRKNLNVKLPFHWRKVTMPLTVIVTLLLLTAGSLGVALYYKNRTPEPLAPYTDDVIVNTYIPLNQTYPKTAVDKFHGYYVVTWASELQVAPNSDYDVYMTLYDNTDNPVISETLVNQNWFNDQAYNQSLQTPTGLDVDICFDGVNMNWKILVVWSTYDPNGTEYNVSMRLFSYDSGTLSPLTNEITVNTYTQGFQSGLRRGLAAIYTLNSTNLAYCPDIAIITWSTFGENGQEPHNDFFGDIFARRYNIMNLSFVDAEEFRVNTGIDGTQTNPDVAANDTTAVFVWENHSSAVGIGVDPPDIYARRYNFTTGQFIDSEDFIVNTNVTGNQLNPRAMVSLSTVLSGSGHFGFVWSSDHVDPDGDIYGIDFYGNGTRIYDDRFIGSSSSNIVDSFPSLSTNYSGDFIVVWASNYTNSGDSDILGYMGNLSGWLGDMFTVNQNTINNQRYPDVAMRLNRSYIPVWASNHNNVDEFNVYKRSYDPVPDFELNLRILFMIGTVVTVILITLPSIYKKRREL